MDLVNQEGIDAFYRVCNENDHSSHFQILHQATRNSTGREGEEEEDEDEEEEEEEGEEVDNNTTASIDCEEDIYFQRKNRALERLEAQGVPFLYPRHQMHRLRRDRAGFEAVLRPYYFHPPIGFNIRDYYSNYDESSALRVQRLREAALAAHNQATAPRGHASALGNSEADIMLLKERKKVAIKRYERIEQFVNRSAGYYASQKVVERHEHLINSVREKYAEIERQIFPEAPAAAEGARMNQTTVGFVLPEEEPMMLDHGVEAEMQPGRNTTGGGSSGSTAIISAAAQRTHDHVEGEGAVFRFGDEATNTTATTITTTTSDGPTTMEAAQGRHREVERTSQRQDSSSF